ncbi:hypothetical protein B6D14_04640 [Gilliamella apis]|nr:hypothetical protein B6D14_04640 [Gilliamella apis]
MIIKNALLFCIKKHPHQARKTKNIITNVIETNKNFRILFYKKLQLLGIPSRSDELLNGKILKM